MSRYVYDDRGQRTLVATTPGYVAKWVALVFGALAALLFVVVLMIWGMKGFGRNQARADARNKVAISKIEIDNQAQRIQVAKQKAEIRLQEAVGIREAQTEIAKTLTPLYVQFEMVDALKQIALSGNNSSVVYIPSGANGIPLVSNVNENNQVQNPG